LAECPHKSCVLITSQSKPKVIRALEREEGYIRSWKVGGLQEAAAREILLEKGLSQPEYWGELIHNYR